MTMNPPDHETKIVWLVKPESVPSHYVREVTVEMPRRRGRPRWSKTTRLLVAYSELDPQAPRFGGGGFRRRVWYLRADDPLDSSYVPCEGVDPLTIRAGMASLDPIPVSTRRMA
jgi:hypothetical protein